MGFYWTRSNGHVWPGLESKELTSRLGYPMARNLRAKVPANDEIFVYDVNATATKSFLDEAQGTPVQAAGSPREVAEKSVSATAFSFTFK